MIPKIIHYCWFGGQPLPKHLEDCIASWRKFCPDYTFMQWNEDNYNVRQNAYLSKCYEQQKWAFVSDYIRLDVVYRYGGIYLDTDVELIKSLDDLLDKTCFLGCEYANDVNTGICFGAKKGHWFIEENKNIYESCPYQELQKTCVEITTDLLLSHGLKRGKGIRHIQDICIFPPEYFNPIHYWTGKLHLTEKTYSIHHSYGSWTKPSKIPMKYKIALRLLIDGLLGDGTYRRWLRRLKFKK